MIFEINAEILWKKCILVFSVTIIDYYNNSMRNIAEETNHKIYRLIRNW